jgi:biopolymer transport protein ExbB/TolQ
MEQNIYKSPSAELGATENDKKGKGLAVLSIVLQLPVYWGFFNFILGMVFTFQTITIYGSGDPKPMASGISNSLVYSLLGCIFSLPGLILSWYVLFKKKYRSKLLCAANIVSSAVWVLSVPWGTIFGIAYFVLIFIKRKSKITKPNKVNH